MHRLAALILSLLFASVPLAWADESETTGTPGAMADVTEGITETARPLLKALSMLGTPYKFGSSKPEAGMDCSGFVRHVYKESNAINLPRTARDMSRQGTAVAKTELKPGDLVFFNTRRKANSHVGIYAGNGEFVHASSGSSKQVTVSRLGDRYWSARFNGARRVLGAP